MFNTAVDDLLIRRNPCRIKGLLKVPKSEAGKRQVAVPDVVIDDLPGHLDRFDGR